MHPLAPVVALDIDGTLGRHHEHMTWFASQWSGRTLYADWQHAEAKGKPGSFSTALRMSKPQYRQCKLAYRQGGMKRSMPVFDGAAELTRAIRRAGAQVWICTTRPYLRLDNIDPDTRHWARRNGIQYDHMLYGEQKYKDLQKICGDRVVCVLDDLPEQIESALSVSLPAFLRVQPHNQYYDNHSADVICNLRQAREEILASIEIWKKANK